MKWVAYVNLLNLIDQNDLNDCIEWYVNLVGTLTVLATVSGSIVSVAVELLWYVLVLR